MDEQLRIAIVLSSHFYDKDVIVDIKRVDDKILYPVEIREKK